MKPLILIILIAGTFGICWGTHPDWLMRCEVVAVAFLALLRGFCDFNPRLPAWMSDQSVRGVSTFALGAGAMFCPANFLLSGWLLGNGIRLMLDAFPDDNPPNSPAIGNRSRDIVLRESSTTITR